MNIDEALGDQGLDAAQYRDAMWFAMGVRSALGNARVNRAAVHDFALLRQAWWRALAHGGVSTTMGMDEAWRAFCKGRAIKL